MAEFDGEPSGPLGTSTPGTADLITEAQERFQMCLDADDRTEALDDLTFLLGGAYQWDAEAVAQRELDSRPLITVNNLPAIIHQVTNDVRQNKQSIHVAPVDDGADPKIAEIIGGIIRHIEYDSDADAAYDTALEGAARVGFGFFRLITEFSDPMSFNQDIKIKRVRNQFTVYMDPDAQEADGSDAKYAFISSKMPRTEAVRQWPDAALSSDSVITGPGDNATWAGKDYVRIAEYYRVEHEAATLCLMRDGTTMLESDKAYNASLDCVAKRPTFTRKVMWYKISAYEVLEQAEIACDTIPIFPVYGDEIDVDNVVTRNGITRNAKSPKQMENYWNCLSLETPIPTPNGWATMRSIGVGDYVLSEEGLPTQVIGKSPVHIGKPCFRVTFDDGSHIIADDSHPWVVDERQNNSNGGVWKRRKVTTAELDVGRHKIQCTKPLAGEHAPLPIDPYVFGYWLGDGTAAAGSITVAAGEIEEVRSAFEARGERVSEARIDPRYGTVGTFTVHGLARRLRALGVFGNKSIPDIYFRASQEQRSELLRGLMDTDGSIAKATRQCCFVNTNERIVQGVTEILHTLGIKVVTIAREGRVSVFPQGHTSRGAEHWQLSFAAPRESVFNSSRKAAIQGGERRDYSRRTKFWGIKSIEPIGSVPVQCIAVDNPTHLFLAGPSMIPTHNTSATEEIALRTKTPFVGALGQFEGVENDWEQANTRNFSYLEYNPISIDGTIVGAPQRQAPADVPNGFLAMAAMSRDAVKAVTGIYDASLGARSNEVSGIALRNRQQQGEISNFHFSDNLTRAITRMAKCLIQMIPRIYDTERVIRILGEDRKTAEHVTINQPTQKPNEQGQMIETVLNDLTVGKYDVTVSTGPAYNTLRQETVANMIELGKEWPKLFDVAGSKLVKAMDWPEAQEISKILALGEPKSPDDDEQPTVQGPNGPIPIDQAGQLLTQLDQTVQQMSAEMEKLESGQAKAELDAKTKLELAEMNNANKLDVAELNGAITLLTNQMAPILAHMAAVQAAADPEHPDAPAPIAQGVERAPGEVEAAEQSHEQNLEAQEASQPEPDAG